VTVLFARALIAFLALPGMVAFVVPVLLAQPRQLNPIGLVPLAIGVAGLLWCVRSFYREGKGTLAPWSPPRHLVMGGLYRYSRNPMYVSVALILWGWAVAFESRTLALYALAVMAAFHLRVVLGEEPWLARMHGDTWTRYRAEVPRWIGKGRQA